MSSVVPTTTTRGDHLVRLWLMLGASAVFVVALLPPTPYHDATGLPPRQAAVLAVFTLAALSLLFVASARAAGISAGAMVLSALSAASMALAAWLLFEELPATPAGAGKILAPFVYAIAFGLGASAGVMGARYPGVRATQILPRILWELLFPAAVLLGLSFALEGHYALAVFNAALPMVVQWLWQPQWQIHRSETSQPSV